MIRNFWRHQRVASLIFVVASLAAAFFAVRLVAAWIYWSDPTHRDAAIEGWMTPGYVAQSWDVPREVVLDAIGITANGRFHQSLGSIAEERGETVDDIARRVAPAILDWRAAER